VGALNFHYLEARRVGLVDPVADGRTLVALHGLQAHADSWAPVAQRLTAVDRVICPDFRGHGYSDWTREGYWLSDYADDIMGLVDQLGLETFDLAGHSLGARVSMVLAGRIGDRLRTVALADTGPEVTRAAGLQARDKGMAKQKADGFRDLDAVREFIATNNPRFPAEAVEIRATKLYRQNWAGLFVMRGDKETIWILGKAGLHEVDDMWNGLKSVGSPVLLIRAEESFLLDDDLSERMIAAMQKPTYVKLAADHFAMYNIPDLFAKTLDEFLLAN
jgi:pimeloyl-ACP methyl ester carboxylesterase